MKRLAALLGALLGALLAASPAGGETLSDVSQLKPGTRIFAYVLSPEHTGELYRVGVYWDRKLKLQQACKGQFRLTVLSISLSSPIELPPNRAHPVRGVWTQRFEFERCGTGKIYNALFVAKGGDKPEVSPYFPGATNAAVHLVADAMPGARAMASLKASKQGGARECKELEVADMRLSRQPQVPGAGNAAGAWQETWTFQRCGARVDVAVTFTPDGIGGAYYSASEK